MGRRRDFDYLRVICSLAVVYLHVAAPALRQGENMGVWHVSNALTSVCTAAVPLFFMISGALALGSDKSADVGDLLKRRLWRIAVPFAVWTGVTVLYFYSRDGRLPELSKLLTTPITTPYWFLYAFLPLTLLSPLLRRLVKGLDGNAWKYLLGLWLVFSILSYTARGFLGDWFGWMSPYTLSFLGGMLGYYLLGYYIATVNINAKAWMLAAVAAGMTLLIAVGTVWSSARMGAYSEQFKSYLSIFVVILAVSLFLFFRVRWAEKTSGKVLSKLANASFGVYLAHPILMDVIRRVVSGETLIQITTLKVQSVYFLAVTGASFALALAVQEIPVLRFLFLGIHGKKG